MLSYGRNYSRRILSYERNAKHKTNEKYEHELEKLVVCANCSPSMATDKVGFVFLLKKHLLKSPVFVGPLYYSRRELSTKVR
jgi:hypothetical protein